MVLRRHAEIRQQVRLDLRHRPRVEDSLERERRQLSSELVDLRLGLRLGLDGDLHRCRSLLDGPLARFVVLIAFVETDRSLKNEKHIVARTLNLADRFSDAKSEVKYLEAGALARVLGVVLDKPAGEDNGTPDREPSRGSVRDPRNSRA